MPDQFATSYYRQLGYLGWFCLLVMSLVFYKERAFFMDAGFQLFNLINEETIQVYHYRFVTGIPQIIPYFLMRSGMPLWVLGMAFSASYILFFTLIYHLLVRYLKNEFLGWTLLLLFTLISLDTYYHMQSEFYLGLALLLFCFGIILRFPDMKEKWLFPVLIPLLITVGFSHKLSLVFFLFLWIFFIPGRKALHHWRYLAFLVLFLAIAAVKSAFFTNWYEGAKQVDFQNHWNKYFPDFHTLPSNVIFLKRCIYHYYLLPVLLLIVSIYYIRTSRWFKMVMVWSFSLGYLLLYNISDPEAAFRFYSEVSYLPLSIFVSVPFLFDVVPSIRKKRLLQAIFAAFILFRLIVIARNHQTFEKQFHWIEEKVEKAKALQTNRLLIRKEQVPMDSVIMEWGIPFTTMHLTSLDHPSGAKTLLVLPDFQWYEDKMEQTNLFFSPFHKVIRTEDLNSNYYRPGQGKYRLLEE